MVLLKTFENELERVIGRPSDLRPFVCQGSPLDCDLFIVGYNPATRMEGDWWQFWKEGYGFQKNLWLEEYLLQRERKMSRTRHRIQAIVHGLEGVNVLEANIDARPSSRKSEYPKPITTPFDFLIAKCRPKVMIAHGSDAVRYLQPWKENGGHLIESPHFIYVGHEKTSKIVLAARYALDL